MSVFSTHLGGIGKTACCCCRDPFIYCEVHDVIPQTLTSDTKKSTSVNYRWKRWHSQACGVHADVQSLRHPAPVTVSHIWLLRSIPPCLISFSHPRMYSPQGLMTRREMNQWGAAEAISWGIILTHITWAGWSRTFLPPLMLMQLGVIFRMAGKSPWEFTLQLPPWSGLIRYGK